MNSETICPTEAHRCEICGRHKATCACLRCHDDGTHTPRRMQAHATEAELRWRHSHWWARRIKVSEQMTRCGESWAKREAFDHCGACARTQWSATLGKRRVVGSFCKSRHCEPCMRAKGNILARNLELKLKDHPHAKYRFVTLTLKHSQTPLKDQLKKLVSSFRKLRNSKWWKAIVHGGAATIEVKRADDGWHPHMHIVVDAGWINQNELSNAWRAITQDSYIVDVRVLKSAHDAAYYVSKYVSKGTSPAVWNDDAQAAEWISATKGCRTCLTFGLWRGFKLTAKGEDPGDWEDERSLSSLINDAAEGDLVASHILLTLRPPGTADAIDWQ